MQERNFRPGDARTTDAGMLATSVRYLSHPGSKAAGAHTGRKRRSDSTLKQRAKALSKARPTCLLAWYDSLSVGVEGFFWRGSATGPMAPAILSRSAMRLSSVNWTPAFRTVFGPRWSGTTFGRWVGRGRMGAEWMHE